MSTNTNTEITPDAARERANREYRLAREAVTHAERNYNINRDVVAARILVAAHEQFERANKVWSSPIPEWHYSR